MLLPFGTVDAFSFFQKCWNLHELKWWWKKSCTNMYRDTFSHFNYFCIYMCVHEFMNLEVHSFHKRHHSSKYKYIPWPCIFPTLCFMVQIVVRLLTYVIFMCLCVHICNDLLLPSVLFTLNLFQVSGNPLSLCF